MGKVSEDYAFEDVSWEPEQDPGDWHATIRHNLAREGSRICAGLGADGARTDEPTWATVGIGRNPRRLESAHKSERPAVPSPETRL